MAIPASAFDPPKLDYVDWDTIYPLRKQRFHLLQPFPEHPRMLQRCHLKTIHCWFEIIEIMCDIVLVPSGIEEVHIGLVEKDLFVLQWGCGRIIVITSK